MERYSSKNHFERLNETTGEVRKHLNSLRKISEYSSILQEDPTWKKRILNEESRFLRPLIVRNVLEMICPDKLQWTDYIDIISSVELFNISTYQSDEVFDFNIRSTAESIVQTLRHSAVQQYISSYITYTLGLGLIYESRLTQDRKLHFTKIMTLAGEKVYAGQYIDAFVLRKHFQKENPLSYSEGIFLEKYLERCAKLDGYQLAMCFRYGCVVDNLFNRSELRDVELSLWNIGMDFGICLQILNDMADLAYINEKSYMEDVINNKISYPIYLLWHHSERGQDLLNNVWNGKSRIDINHYKEEITSIIFEAPIMLEKLIEILMLHYRKISSEVKKINFYGISDIHFLDFINRFKPLPLVVVP